MADNVTINPGSGGAVIRTEDVGGGVEVQHVKINAGAAGVDGGPVTDTNPLPTKQYSGTATESNVAASASSVTLLAANTARRGATIFNDSVAAALYVKHGVTASSTSFTVKLGVGDYYEVPFGFIGRIDGIWSAADSGAARITEFT